MMKADIYLYFIIAIILNNICLLAYGQDSKAQCTWSGCGADSCDNATYPHKWATGTCEENFLCLSGSSPRLYCCEVPSPYTETYWIGTPPFCGVSCDDCKVNDECIISQDPCGDGSACVSGSKTLCGQLHPRTSGKVSSYQPVSWNFLQLFCSLIAFYSHLFI